jgi:hypothetical protein
MPRKPGPKKRQVLIRLLDTTAEYLETKAESKGYPSLPAYLSDRIERQAETSRKNEAKQ